MYPCKVKAQCAVQGCYIVHFISKRSRFCSTWNRSRTTVWQDCRTPLELTRLPVLLDSYGFRRSCTLFLFTFHGTHWCPCVQAEISSLKRALQSALLVGTHRLAQHVYYYITRGTMSGHRFYEKIHACYVKLVVCYEHFVVCNKESPQQRAKHELQSARLTEQHRSSKFLSVSQHACLHLLHHMAQPGPST